MPLKSAKKNHKSAPKHKHSKPYLKTYWPYLPMAIIIVCGFFYGGIHFNGRPIHSVLSYTVGASNNSLLQATNEQRTSNGKTSLKLNQQLINAAQAKAQDMVARNYWSHNTPEGHEPWVFVENSGYKYSHVGENLAYGFTSSSTTINGWMNSPTHKENLLSDNFTEVGFGYANSTDFVQSGPETVVVAIYGKPLDIIQISSGATDTPTISQSAITTSTLATQQSTSNTNSSQGEQAEKSITKIDSVTNGKSPWLIGVISILMLLGAGFLAIKYSHKFIRMLKNSENYISKHPIVDTIIVALIMIGYIMSSTTGIIR